MTDSVQPNRFNLRKVLWIALMVFLVLLLVGAYIIANLSVAPMMRIAYKKGDCATIQQWNNIADTFYLVAKNQSPELAGYIAECDEYLAAYQKLVDQSWQDADVAYRLFEEKYANDPFSARAHQEHAQVIVEIIRMQLASGQFDNATKNIDVVLGDYADTPFAKEAEKLAPEVIEQWGVSFRDNQDFVSAETKFKELDTWARAHASQEYVDRSVEGLTQTYLAWAKALEADGKYTDAIAKYQTVIQIDPNPKGTDSPAMQAGIAIPNIYIKWGDGFLAQNKYSDAFTNYQKALELSSEEKHPEIKDMVAKGYHQWADQLVQQKNFLEALNKAELAQGAAGTDAFKKELVGMQNEIFLAFSSSSGPQVEVAMRDIGKQICTQGKPYKHPIFGIDQANKQFLLYGVETRLPNEILAKTPGTTHYIVCIEIETKVIESRKLPTLFNGYLIFNEALGIYIEMAREQYIWKVTVRNAQSGEVVGQDSFTGSLPPPLPAITMANAYSIVSGGPYQRYRGDNPDINVIVAWLKTLVK